MRDKERVYNRAFQVCFAFGIVMNFLNIILDIQIKDNMKLYFPYVMLMSVLKCVFLQEYIQNTARLK